MAAFDPVLKKFVANGSFLTVDDMNTGTIAPAAVQLTYSPILAPQFQGSVIGINGVAPVHPTMTVTDGPIDQKASDIYYDGNGMQFRFLNDSYLTSTTWLAVLRTGTAATLVTVTAPVINLAGTAKVSGYPIFHSGNLSFGTGLTLTNGVLTSNGGVGGSSQIATTTVAGLVKPGPLGTLALSSDGSGSVEVVSQTITAGTPPATLSGLRLVMDNGQSISGAQLQALLGTTSGTPPSVATSYTTVISAASGAVGTAFTISFTPNAPWPSTEVITLTSTLAGTFNPATIAVIGSNVGTATFTPSSAGTGTINSTTSPSLSNTSGGQTYTATAAVVYGYPVTFAGAAGAAPSGNAALTQLGTNSIATAALDGSGGLKLPSVAKATGSFRNAGKVKAGAQVTVTFSAGSLKSILIILCDDGAGNYYTGEYLGGSFYISQYSPGGSTALGQFYCTAPTSTISFYTDLNSSGVNALSDGTYQGGVNGITLLPPGYAGVGSGTDVSQQVVITKVSIA